MCSVLLMFSFRSGDGLIFGGASRLLWHGVSRVTAFHLQMLLGVCMSPVFTGL